ncbi:sensor histidine kinase [Kitasatospora viridis]|uniref:Oxygen sensor histidine kinase NreB n=1 Tax=Kitasatospora viridis TaxID=281105 RepID=A0A561T7H4_9ACTN|nr:sensor histidine kinase [Kitasatospora viridis]TWF83050.1 signal transduction histidine kinase [Kitasatospora viridis]
MRNPIDLATDRDAERDARWLVIALQAAFVLLLTASLTRYLSHHGGSALAPWVVALSAALAAVQLLGARRRSPANLAAVVALWVLLVLLAPSFAWCAVPLIYGVLRTLRARAAIPLVAAFTALVVVAELRLANGFDTSALLVPTSVAGLATAVFQYMERQADRQRRLIVDLVLTRRELAATERREGTLAERERLAREIHDTLAQGLSSQRMLLQAADRTWDRDPKLARRHVRTATQIAARNLAEARRFVRDLAPVELADGSPLEAALRALAERESTESGLPVRFQLDGIPVPLPAAARNALFRVAQGALANIREHADASTAALTLSYLDDQTVLDITDDGRGLPLTGTMQSDSEEDRGYGLPAMQARLKQLGGALAIESTPGDGTVLSATIPLEVP